MESWVQSRADGLVPMCFAIFPVVSLKYCACPEKVKPGHTKCCTCHAKSSSQTWTHAPKCNPSQEISALTSRHLWWTCLLYCACHAKCIFPMSQACHRLWKCYKTLTFYSLLTRCTIPCACHGKRHLNVQKCSVPLCFFHFWLGNVLRATTACTFSTCQLPKVVRAWRVLYILTSKRASHHNGVRFFDISTKVVRTWCVLCILTSTCALRHKGVHFFDISTSKSAPTYWLGNVLRATPARIFSTSQLLKVLRGWGVLYILTWKCASRHSGAHFFDISASKSAPRLRCFVHFDLEMCFAPQWRATFHLSSGQMAPHPPL